MEVRGCKGKYEEVLEEGRGPRVPRSKSSKVHGSQGPKDQDISNSHSNTSLTLKKVHLVVSFNHIPAPNIQCISTHLTFSYDPLTALKQRNLI